MAVDFIIRLATGAISTVADYKDFIVFNWGGILAWERVIALLAGYLGLLAVFRMFGTATLNPSRNRWMPWCAVILLGLNYLYFEYANFLRHWIFIVAILLWQIYFLIKIIENSVAENPQKATKYWVGQALLIILSFGISYRGLMYQVIWIPALVGWIRHKKWQACKAFGLYVLSSIVGMGIIWWWYPYGFQRVLGMV